MPIERSQVERWLREDLGHHDVTNDIPGETTGRLLARESGVAAGISAARAVFEYLDVPVTASVTAGERVAADDTLLAVEGPTRDVLRGERVAANIVGHAAGIATRTRAAVERAREASDEVRVAATRKTTPGLRGVEKRAVAAGGGDTHRLDLSHMVMVKENHIANLGLEQAVERFRERASFATKIECEVERPADAPRAAAAGADAVLLDNMSPAETARAVDLLDGAALAEASGGIGLEDVADYAATGVDVVSMGTLTHSADQLDVSFQTG
ncbi:carboxylating nicotinate-nucleotide diphosphorylase [Halosegnis sp.]|uniref:carboxylating nicotinate-nucleotide diphosphorylase n=1 Tax=Halosegnis sp. TaxID=2864959 RepID=UPI0035D4F7B7